MVGAFQSRINSARLTNTGPRIFKLWSNNFNVLTNEYGTENRVPYFIIYGRGKIFEQRTEDSRSLTQFFFVHFLGGPSCNRSAADQLSPTGQTVTLSVLRKKHVWHWKTLLGEQKRFPVFSRPYHLSKWEKLTKC